MSREGAEREREREREREIMGGAERERERENPKQGAGCRVPAVSAKPDLGLDSMNHEITT